MGAGSSPRPSNSVEYVQYLPDPATGFREYQHGIEYLAQQYPRWVEVFKLSDLYGEDAVSMGPDGNRSYDADDTGDGYDIFVDQADRQHRLGRGQGDPAVLAVGPRRRDRRASRAGLRAVEDLAMAAENGGTIADGVEGYESTTGTRA